MDSLEPTSSGGRWQHISMRARWWTREKDVSREGGGRMILYTDPSSLSPLLTALKKIKESLARLEAERKVEKIWRPSTAISFIKASSATETQESRSIYSLVTPHFTARFLFTQLQSRFTYSRRKTAAHTSWKQKERASMKASSALCAVKHSDYHRRLLPVKTP